MKHFDGQTIIRRARFSHKGKIGAYYATFCLAKNKFVGGGNFARRILVQRHI